VAGGFCCCCCFVDTKWCAGGRRGEWIIPPGLMNASLCSDGPPAIGHEQHLAHNRAGAHPPTWSALADMHSHAGVLCSVKGVLSLRGLQRRQGGKYTRRRAGCQQPAWAEGEQPKQLRSGVIVVSVVVVVCVVVITAPAATWLGCGVVVDAVARQSLKPGRRCRNEFLPLHEGLQGGGDAHGAVRLLVLFQQRDEHSGHLRVCACVCVNACINQPIHQSINQRMNESTSRSRKQSCESIPECVSE
jgi:hypothetical protein